MAKLYQTVEQTEHRRPHTRQKVRFCHIIIVVYVMQLCRLSNPRFERVDGIIGGRHRHYLISYIRFKNNFVKVFNTHNNRRGRIHVTAQNH